MSIIAGFDITAANYPHKPGAGQIMVYRTGSNGIPATAAMLEAHPGAVWCDQASEEAGIFNRCDVFDMEKGALTLAALPVVIRDALDAWDLGERPGQRQPLVYASAGNMNDVVTELDRAGLQGSGVGLFVAHWGVSVAYAASQIGLKIGAYPIGAYQYATNRYYDLDLFSGAWLGHVSVKPEPKARILPEAPPGQWRDPGAWTWREARITGTGLDGKLYSFAYNTGTGKWAKT